MKHHAALYFHFLIYTHGAAVAALAIAINKSFMQGTVHCNARLWKECTSSIYVTSTTPCKRSSSALFRNTISDRKFWGTGTSAIFIYSFSTLNRNTCHNSDQINSIHKLFQIFPCPYLLLPSWKEKCRLQFWFCSHQSFSITS